MAFSVGSSNLIDLGSPGISSYPFSMVGWFRVPDVNALLELMELSDSGSNDHHRLQWNGHLANDYAAARSDDHNGGAVATSSITMTPNVWHHVAGVWVSSTKRTVYLDGGNSGTSTVNRVFGSMDTLTVGESSGSDDIDIAEIGVFDDELTTTEIALLAQGLPVLCLERTNLVKHLSCIRQLNHPAWKAAASHSGSLSVVNHPPIQYAQPGRSQIMPHRLPGPWRIEDQELHARIAQQGELLIGGAGGATAELFITGVVADDSTYGEVVA